MLARRPVAGAPDQDAAVIPPLAEEFDQYLGLGSSAAASDDLKELVRSRLCVANAADTAINKDVTWESGNVTLAFSDGLRVAIWLVEKLRATSHTAAQNCIGMLQFLTPDRDALSVVVEGDLQVRSLIMANASSGSAQIDASKSSKMYCAGRLTTFRHSYEAFCNLRLLLSIMVADVDSSMLVTKMREYIDVLMDRQGRLFYETCREQPHLAVHPWQDLQHILSAFWDVATQSDLTRAVTDDGAVALANYANPLAVADAAISELRAIINGNGLGKFGGVPCCSPWFSSRSPPPGRLRGGGDLSKEGESKKPRLDAQDLERKKTLGILEFDPEVAGTTRLPILGVHYKKRGAKIPERLCMKYLTRGYACPNRDCRFPHVGYDALSDSDKKCFVEAVKKQPGLSWVEGKAPPGTST